MFKMCQQVVSNISQHLGDAWSRTSISSKLDCIKHQTHTLQHTVSPPHPRHTPTISHANMELFLTLCTRTSLKSLCLRLRNLLNQTPVCLGLALKLQIAEEDCFCCWRMARRRRLPHQQTLDTRHVNYPINLTFSASDVIQTQNMDCWRCWQWWHPLQQHHFYLIVSLSPVASIGIWLLTQTKCSISTVRNSIFRSTKQRIKLSSIWLVFCIFSFTLSPDSVTGVDKVFLWRCEPGLTFVLF